MSRNTRVFLTGAAVFIPIIICVTLSGRVPDRLPGPGSYIFAQEENASPSGSMYQPLPSLEPTPLVIYREPEQGYYEAPELPLITNLRKFLYFLAELIGVKIPPRTSGTGVYMESSGSYR